MNHLISVIIPVRNGANYIKKAIEGIRQQGMDLEIIVADDASTDNTCQIAQDYGCKIVKHDTQRGQVAGKNNGLKIARGKYILFHDHDDVMQPGALQKLYEALEPDVMAVEAKIQDWYSPDLPFSQRAKTIIKPAPYWGSFSGAILINKEVFDHIGYFNESVYSGEIIEWKSKMDAHNFRIKKLDFVSTRRRIHATNFGKTHQRTEFHDYATLLREKLKNRGKMGPISK